MAKDFYRTEYGRAVLTRAEDYLPCMPDASADLIMTSPPFALLRQKAYGNLEQAEYVDWLVSFGPQIRRVLKDTGSFVLDLGGAYQRGVPCRSLYNYRVLLRFCDEHGFFLAEEFFWHNPAKLPSPIEWVNKRKIRAKDSVNTVWWLSKSEFPQADITQVLAPYSARMKKLIPTPKAIRFTSGSARRTASSRIPRVSRRHCPSFSSSCSRSPATWCSISLPARTRRAKRLNRSAATS